MGKEALHFSGTLRPKRKGIPRRGNSMGKAQ